VDDPPEQAETRIPDCKVLYDDDKRPRKEGAASIRPIAVREWQKVYAGFFYPGVQSDFNRYLTNSTPHRFL
jgi:hypothetical protein